MFQSHSDDPWGEDKIKHCSNFVYLILDRLSFLFTHFTCIRYFNKPYIEL